MTESHDKARRPADLWYWGSVAALTGLAFVGTLVIRIPIPMTAGYFNLGDIFVVFAALYLGPRAGLIVGGVGPALADAVGFPLYIPATMFTKGLEGLLVGVISRRFGATNVRGHAIAAYAGGFMIVLGYFSFQAFLYPAFAQIVPAFGITNVGEALGEIPFNCAQWLIGATIGLGLWKATGRAGASDGIDPED